MVIADAEGAWFVRGRRPGRPQVLRRSTPGVHMVTAHDPNDPASPRARANCRDSARRPRRTRTGRVGGLGGLLGRPLRAARRRDQRAAEGGFGTVCASLAAAAGEGRPVWLFAAGPPDQARVPARGR